MCNIYETVTYNVENGSCIEGRGLDDRKPLPVPYTNSVSRYILRPPSPPALPPAPRGNSQPQSSINVQIQNFGLPLQHADSSSSSNSLKTSVHKWWCLVVNTLIVISSVVGYLQYLLSKYGRDPRLRPPCLDTLIH